MVRNKNIALCIILSLFSCGIYGVFWYVALTDDVNEVTGEDGPSGWLCVLFSILTCGIYDFFWAHQQGEKLDRSRTASGASFGNLGMLYMGLKLGAYVAVLFGIFASGGVLSGLVGNINVIIMALMQDEVNKYVPTK